MGSRSRRKHKSKLNRDGGDRDEGKKDDVNAVNGDKPNDGKKQERRKKRQPQPREPVRLFSPAWVLNLKPTVHVHRSNPILLFQQKKTKDRIITRPYGRSGSRNTAMVDVLPWMSI